AEFAVATLQQWWRQMGVSTYPEATELLIIADGGGSNGVRIRLWKTELQRLADETGLRIAVCHLPPGTSKWNKIEHRINWLLVPTAKELHVVATEKATAAYESGGVRKMRRTPGHSLAQNAGDRRVFWLGRSCCTARTWSSFLPLLQEVSSIRKTRNQLIYNQVVSLNFRDETHPSSETDARLYATDPGMLP